MMSASAILTRFRGIATSLGFQEADARYPIEHTAEAGGDGRFLVRTREADGLFAFHGHPDNRRQLLVTILVGYFRGGGDAGGDAGGDRLAVCKRALADCVRLADACESPLNYQPETTGIRRVLLEGFQRVADLARSEVWETRLIAEWTAAEVSS